MLAGRFELPLAIAWLFHMCLSVPQHKYSAVPPLLGRLSPPPRSEDGVVGVTCHALLVGSALLHLKVKGARAGSFLEPAPLAPWE